MRFLKAFLLINLFVSSSCFSEEDPINNLIDNEKGQYEKWIYNEDDLPAVFLSGDSNSILIYSDHLENVTDVSLCSEVSWEELIDNSIRTSGPYEFEVNFMSPKIRDIWASTCLIRPQDQVMAIGRGQQAKVSIEKFILKSKFDMCANESFFEIHALLSNPLPPDPLFYSTDNTLLEGENSFKSPRLSTSTDRNMAWTSLVDQTFQFSSEYEMEFYSSEVVGSTQSIGFVHLQKEEISENDIGLPHEAIAAFQDKGIQVLAVEKVNKDHLSGHVDVPDVFDFNRDGFIDLIIDGDRNGCFFRRLFIGSTSGFEDVVFPQPNCACQ